MIRRHFVISDVCRLYAVSREDFFSRKRTADLVEARRFAIDTLRGWGLSLPAIGRIIHRDHTTVCYWIHPGWREKKRETMRRHRVKAMAA